VRRICVSLRVWIERRCYTLLNVAEGDRVIAQQRGIVARLERSGRGSSETARIARDLLLSMQRVQRAHISHLDQLRAEWARLAGVDVSPATRMAFSAPLSFSASASGPDDMREV
jgi:hypothetical protein